MHTIRLRAISFSVALAAVGLLSGGARADTIILKSGDSFTGTITLVGADAVDVNTPFAGTIHVKRDAIKSLRSEAKVGIVAADGTQHAAFLAPNADGAGFHEVDVAAPPPAVAAAPAPPPAPVPEKVYNLNLEPYYLPVGPHWKNQFSLGIVNTTGNTDETSFASEVNFHYNEKPQEFTLKIGGVYDTTNGQQTAGQAYLDAVYRRIMPEWDKSERWYVFGENHELYDGIKEISYRITNGLGVGYFVVKSDKLTVDVRGGPAYVCEKFFNGDSNSAISGIAGLRVAYTLNERVSLTEEALYTFSVENFSDYQLMSETALNMKLPEVARGVGLKFAFRDDYDNNAPTGKKDNDTRLTLSLTLDF